MPRPEGTKNKTTILKSDNEDKFLAEVLERYTYWKAEAIRAKGEGQTGEREGEFAEAYRVLLNKFSNIGE
ncbi:MAG: hypothetical protein ACTHMC_01495 [Pseudobacter sp.]|uniref:hypothetical protein n=1 Tax=Pseudobacter sp. TaxID=2045420 RepID=UPI003F8194DB